MRARITARLLSQVTPREREYEVVDTALPRFLLRVRPTGRCAYYVQLGRGRRIKVADVPHLTPDEARERATAILGNAAKGRDPLEGLRSGGQTLDDFLTDHYEHHVTAKSPEATAKLIRRLRTSFAHLLGRDLGAITTADLESWKARRLREGLKAATIKRDLWPLSGVYRHAKKLQLVAHNPVTDVDKPRHDSTGRTRYLSAAEEARLREALAARDARIRAERTSANKWRAERGYELLPDVGTFGDALTPAVLLSLATGMRLGELLKMKWEDVDLEAAQITLRDSNTKSGKTRHLPLTTEAVDVLRKWRPYAPRELVIGVKTSFKKSFGAVLTAAKIDRFRWHDLRHCFASKLAQRSVSLNVIRDLLGHADLKMVMRYAHLAPENFRAAIDALEARP